MNNSEGYWEKPVLIPVDFVGPAPNKPLSKGGGFLARSEKGSVKPLD